MPVSKNEIEYLKSRFQKCEINEDATIISLSLPINVIYNDFPINEVFKVKIIIPDTYPMDVPAVVDVDAVISNKYEHKYKDGTLCLGIYGEIMFGCSGHLSIQFLIDNYIVPYFYSYKYYQRFKEYPFGERTHGAIGIIEGYMELLNFSNAYETFVILQYILESGYRGHGLCPCGSGKRFRDCHLISKEILYKMNNVIIKNVMLKDLNIIKEELRYYERYCKKTK